MLHQLRAVIYSVSNTVQVRRGCRIAHTHTAILLQAGEASKLLVYTKSGFFQIVQSILTNGQVLPSTQIFLWSAFLSPD